MDGHILKDGLFLLVFHPLMAYLITLTKNKGIISLLIKLGIFVGLYWYKYPSRRFHCYLRLSIFKYLNLSIIYKKV